MTAIWYSAEDDRLVIEGALQTYAPRTLMAVLDGDQIMVRLKVNSRNEFGPAPYTEIHDATGVASPTAPRRWPTCRASSPGGRQCPTS
ncbi:hypothetical protein SR39_06115 [Methylobacterium radiotolerans]|nr:hypothetical protein SR39_06115 [Methylobacterium radiotolerans]